MTVMHAGPGPGPGKHVVRRKDTLYSLALKYHTTMAALKKANGLKSNEIKIGQALKIPGKATKRGSAESEFLDLMNKQVDYAYRSEGPTKSVSFGSTPYGQSLKDQWSSYFKQYGSLEFLNFFPQETNIALWMTHEKWSTLTWGEKAGAYDVGRSGYEATFGKDK